MRRMSFAVAALVLAVLLFATLLGGASAQTTIGSGVELPRQSSITFITPTVITATYNSPAIDLSAYNVLEMQAIVDQTAVNTFTAIVQSSMDGTNWLSGDTLLTDNAADADTYLTPTMILKWSRLHVTVANTNPFTMAVYAVSQ